MDTKSTDIPVNANPIAVEVAVVKFNGPVSTNQCPNLLLFIDPDIQNKRRSRNRTGRESTLRVKTPDHIVLLRKSFKRVIVQPHIGAISRLPVDGNPFTRLK